MSDITITPIDRLELAFAPKPWAFADERRAEIDVFFAELQREKPEMWNGRVLLLHDYTIDGGVFRGAYLETDYASFAAWGAWGHPPAAVYDCFGAAAILCADGAFLLGRMGAHTFNAGHIYFPSGTPDPSDIVDDKIDLESNIRRELKEETGLDISGFIDEPGWTTVFEGGLIGHIKVLRSDRDAASLRARILETLAGEYQPELADILIVRNTSDFDSQMRGFVKAFLAHRFAGG